MLKVLQIIFVIAKILGLISWSWWIVLFPLFIELTLYALSLILSVVIFISKKF